MTTRTDSAGDMVAQLIRMVSDMQVELANQRDLLQAQQDAIEVVASNLTRLQGAAWQLNKLGATPRG